ncbi:MAG: hypothetical protein EBQ96_04905 [Proteobacteria bacterium]|nr:hypothetical protein [Pseudomonadota bacterium]
MQNAPQPPFFLFDAFTGGIRIFAQNSRLILRLSFIPFAVTLLTLVVLRTFNDSLTMFWLPVLQMPSSFVTGLQCGLILRYLVLQEFPLVQDEDAKKIRNKAITESAFAYMAVTYFVTGVYAVVVKLQGFMKTDPEAAAPYMPLAAGLLILMLWGSRWLWLHIPLAIDWPIRDFYSRIGKWSGSLRIFALFAMCSLTMNFFAGICRSLVAAFSGTANNGFVAAFDDAIVAAITLMLSVLFTTVSVAAIQMISSKSTKQP